MPLFPWEGRKPRFLLVIALVLGGCQVAEFKPGESFQECADCPAMVVVPPGEFRMGFDGGEEGRYEGPARDVQIDYSFAVGKFEVTQAQYATFVSETQRPTRGGCQVWQGEWKYPPEADWTNPGYGEVPFDDDPVACVSWDDAFAYAAWLSQKTKHRYRLLSEAEWEYAARAGATTEYFWGPAAPSETDDTAAPAPGYRSVACDFANVYDETGAKTSGFRWQPFHCDDGFGRMAPVGSFRPNAFGLYDMIGNVWEWVGDCYEVPYPAKPVDGRIVGPPQGECEGMLGRRVARGGSWITRPSRQRVTFRGRDPPETLYSFFGFRVARDL
jgi:formylglycine-generating enzyme required for sulfatase activity